MKNIKRIAFISAFSLVACNRDANLVKINYSIRTKEAKKGNLSASFAIVSVKQTPWRTIVHYRVDEKTRDSVALTRTGDGILLVND